MRYFKIEIEERRRPSSLMSDPRCKLKRKVEIARFEASWESSTC